MCVSLLRFQQCSLWPYVVLAFMSLIMPATALGDGTEVTWVSEKDLRTIGWHLLCPCLAVQECRIVGSGCLQ